MVLPLRAAPWGERVAVDIDIRDEMQKTVARLVYLKYVYSHLRSSKYSNYAKQGERVLVVAAITKSPQSQNSGSWQPACNDDIVASQSHMITIYDTHCQLIDFACQKQR